MSSSQYLRDICRLRIAVAFLGEKTQFAWWKSSFLTSTGWRFLERLFPRTSRQAGVEASIEAAKRVHDEAIGKGGVAHLFRLGEEIEAQLHKTLLSFSAADIESLCASADSTQTLLNTEFPGKVAPAIGPIQVGALSEASQPGIVEILAKHYRSAFSSGTPVFPYLR